MKINLKPQTPAQVSNLIYYLLDIFNDVGVPVSGTDRQLERMSKACLAVGKITNSFSQAQSSKDNTWSKTREIITFENNNYGENISSGSYDDIRRKDLKLLVDAGIVVNSSSQKNQATNNPSRAYALNPAFVDLIKKFNKPEWEESIKNYLKILPSLKNQLERNRTLNIVPVVLPGGEEIVLSYGAHNNLQKAIIEEFLPRFGFGAQVLYVGDTSDKFLYLNQKVLDEINFFKIEHEELPDVIAYSVEKKLLYLIEAYHSTGEWSEIRLKTIKEKLRQSNCTVNVVYFTAFENKEVFKSKAKDIAWETEVWISDVPDHLVHFNGFKFLEIHKDN